MKKEGVSNTEITETASFIEVVVNGETVSVPENATIADVLSLLKIKPGEVAVAVNGEVITASRIQDVTLKKGDELLIVTPVQGG